MLKIVKCLAIFGTHKYIYCIFIGQRASVKLENNTVTEGHEIEVTFCCKAKRRQRRILNDAGFWLRVGVPFIYRFLDRQTDYLVLYCFLQH